MSTFEWPDCAAAFRLVPATGRLVVYANPTLLQIAFENVLRNALFYTPPGSEVAVTVTRVGDRARVEIRDHGPGIGLAIDARVITLHGGVVSVPSGLCITVKSPRVPSVPASPAAVAADAAFPYTSSRYVSPSRTIRPAVAPAKCVPITSTGVPASVSNIRSRVRTPISGSESAVEAHSGCAI
jgi:hypothetical protein